MRSTADIMQLEIEREALKKEKDKASKQRLHSIEEELAELKAETRRSHGRWQAEQEAISKVQEIREQIDEIRVRDRSRPNADTICKKRQNCITANCANWNPNSASRSAVCTIQEAGALLKEEVDAEDIATVVSSWTGMPVCKLMEGEVEKLIKMEDRLHDRVVGQDEAVSGGLRCDASFTGRAARPEQSYWILYLSRPDRRRQDRTCESPGRVPFR